MRSFLGGFLGLCLGLALLPDVASARTDARSSAQNSSSSRAVTASRPATSRPVATTTRQASTSRATASRTTTGNRTMARSSGTSRQAAAIPYARQPAAQAPRGLRQTAMASCTTRNGRRVCAPGATRTASFRWTGGLAPAAMSQAGCPDGTIATMAFGHNDITRCVPL